MFMNKKGVHVLQHYLFHFNGEKREIKLRVAHREQNEHARQVSLCTPAAQTTSRLWLCACLTSSEPRKPLDSPCGIVRAGPPPPVCIEGDWSRLSEN